MKVNPVKIKIKIKRRTITSLILALVFIIIPFIKCQKINNALFGEKEPSVNDIISNGKKKLSEGNFQEAAKIFAEGVKIYPNNPEIRFGLALAQSAILLKNVENVTLELGNIIIQLVSGTSPRHIRPYQSEKQIQAETTINTLLDDIFQANIIDISEKIIENLEIPRKEKNWSFKVDKFSWRIEFQGKEWWRLDLDGIEFDNADANLLYGVLKAVQGLIKFILSIDLDVKLENVVRTFQFIQELGIELQISSGGVSAGGISVRDVIIRVIPFLLNERENLLGIEPKKGRVYWKEVPELFTSSAEAFAMMLDSIKQETDSQADDFIAQAGENLFAIPTSSSSIFVDDKLSNEFGKLPRSKLEIPASLKDDFSQIAKSFQSTERVSWQSLINAILTFIIGIVRTGIFDELIRALTTYASGVGIQQNVVNNLIQFVNPQILSSLITGIIPNELQFDFHAFFSSSEGGIRAILPAWTADHRFIFEWECFSDSPGIIPLAESNPIYQLFCKMPKTSYCFEKKYIGTCDIKLQECNETFINPQETTCSLYCPIEVQSCQGDGRLQMKVCELADEKTEKCLKYCTETKILKRISGESQQFCVSTIRFEDSEHFSQDESKKYIPGKGVKLPEPIKKDGIATVFPYIGFQSPDFLGLLYINSGYLSTFSKDVPAVGFKKPDQFEINLFIQIMGTNLERLLAQFGII
jgi:hypothetical protein